jgi:hypothetical protein
VINRLLTTKTVWANAIIGVLLLGGGWNSVAAQQPPPNVPVLGPLPAQPAQFIAPPQAMPAIPAPRFRITIDPKTPLTDLLPPPPKATAQKPSAFVDDLANVPELMLTEPLANEPDNHKAIEALALQIAKINHLNKEKPDRFMEVLLKERPDLAGLPFQMGTDCRLSSTRSLYFKKAVAIVHNSVNRERQTGVVDAPIDEFTQPAPIPAPATRPRQLRSGNFTFESTIDSFSRDDGDVFLLRFLQGCLADDGSTRPIRAKEHRENATSARIAAMTQICGPTSDSMKLAMARYLASVSSVDSTHALVKTILFTPEEDARNVAIEALKGRRDKDYVDSLLQGFRYPWPEVAKRAADALVKLDRKDLVPQIIDVLDEPDPRAPVTKTANGKTVTTVRELVRINHHRNCAMCHAPGKDVQNNSDILTAEAPVPGQPLPSFDSGGYGSQGIPELLVRIDVTYLRQDFSMMLPVVDSAPWPKLQRFDFVARTRPLNDDEVKVYKDKFDKLEQGVLPPNHRAALAALRELTGKDTTPTADAWRKLVTATK